MADYGVVESGFNPKSRDDILEGLRNRARTQYGDSLNLKNGSPLDMFLQLISWELSKNWQEMNGTYNSSFVNTSLDQSLENVGQYIGISKKNATKAYGNITIYGDIDVVVPKGFQVDTGGAVPVIFETLEEVIIPSGGSVQAKIRSLEKGANGNVSAGDITNITNPIAGVDSVDNESATAGGADEESDYEFRERYKESIDIAGGSTINSIRASILENTDASACIVLENRTNSTDDNGLPGKSFEPIVLGGAEASIAEAIFDYKPAGIESYGSIIKIVFDDVGLEHLVGFSRATRVDIYVDIELTTSNAFPLDGQSTVENSVLEYINNLSISEDVIYTQIIKESYAVVGIEDINITVGISDNPTGTSNVAIGFREVAKTETTMIDITEV